MSSEHPAAATKGLSLSYSRRATALNDVTVDFADGAITGLIGRNGAGKTSLLRVLAGREPRFTGDVQVLGLPVRKLPAGAVHVCVDWWPFAGDLRIGDLTQHLRRVHTRFDQERARELLDAFGIDPRRRAGALSRGQLSAALTTLALASRADLVMLDEPHLGMDAPSRALLNRACVEDAADMPGTLIISTHLVDETAGLFERVVILDRGQVVASDDVDSLCAAYARVDGPYDLISSLPTLQPVERIGNRGSAVVARTDAPDPHDAHVTPVTLQELSGALSVLAPSKRTTKTS